MARLHSPTSISELPQVVEMVVSFLALLSGLSRTPEVREDLLLLSRAFRPSEDQDETIPFDFPPSYVSYFASFGKVTRSLMTPETPFIYLFPYFFCCASIPPSSLLSLSLNPPLE